MKSKRFITMLLAVSLVFSMMLPGMSFAADTATVTFDLAGGHIVGGGSATASVAVGACVTAPTVENSGYDLVGWYQVYTINGVTGVESEPFDFSQPITADITLRAAWTARVASSITLSEERLDLNPGDTATLTATVVPNTVPVESWTSSNQNVATVANGVVTAVASGAAVITASAGGQMATCTVTVTEIARATFVAEGYTAEGGSYVDSYTTLDNAITAANNAEIGYILLVADVEEQDLMVSRSMILDLNGHSVVGSSSAQVMTVGGSATLTVQDSSAAQDGYIDSTYANDGTFFLTGSIVLKGGEIKNSSGGAPIGIAMAGSAVPTVEVSGGKITTSGYAVETFGTINLIVSGGQIQASKFAGNPYFGSTVNATITGGSFKGMSINTSAKTIDGKAIAAGYMIAQDNDLGAGWYKVQTHNPHDYSYGTPTWLWKVENGTWSVYATYIKTCATCGKTETETVKADWEVTAETYDEIVYTATDAHGNSNEHRLTKQYTVDTVGDIDGTTYTFSYGNVCKLEASDGVASDWTIEITGDESTQVIRARNTETFYFAVTGNVTVRRTPTDPGSSEDSVIAVMKAESEAAKTLTFKFVWSIPEGAAVKSAMIYRCRDDSAAINSAEALLASAGLRSYDTKMFVRNGEFTYIATRLTSGSKQTIMFRLIYTVDGTDYTLDTPLSHISIG